MPRARNICAVVPVKETGRAKQRLARVLSRQQRQLLVQAMFEDVLTALTQATGLAAILVSTADRGIAAIAARYGARVLEEAAADGHSAAVAAAAARLDASGYDMLTLPADIPLVQPEDISHLLLAHRKATQSDSRGFTIAPARDERGSNAVLCSPARAIPLQFGENSFLPHLAAAKARGIEPVVVKLPRVALDIDTPGDLALLLRERAPTRTHAQQHRLKHKPHHPAWASLQGLVESLVIQSAAHGRELLTKIPGMCCSDMPVVGVLILPDLDNGEVVWPTGLLQYLESNYAGLLSALVGQRFEQGYAVILAGRGHVHMRHHMNRTRRTCGGRTGDVHAAVHPVVNRADEMRFDLVAQGIGIRGRDMRIVVLPVLPDRHRCELI
jgi:2-phospho-L-lactate/phosphoenolpyruvate guanylyltransferase